MTSSKPYLIRALYEWITDNGTTPLVLVDAGAAAGELPGEYVENGQIVLNIGPSAVRNLELGNEYCSFEARFGGRPMRVSFRSEAVLALYARENGQGMIFDSQPPGGDDDPSGGAEPSGEGDQRGHLKVVK